jgi:hypothetical protein
MKKSEIVAIDTGNGRTKVAYWQDGEIKTDVFVSVVYEGTGGKTQIGQKENSFYSYLFGQDGYCVFPEGDTASSRPIDLISEGGYSGNAVKALFLTALLRNGFSGKNVAFISNLPIGEYFQKTFEGYVENGEKVNAKLDMLGHTRVDYFTGQETGVELPKVVNGSIYAEGAAAFVDYLINDQGEINAVPSSVQVVDIGSGTIDVCVVHDDHSISFTQTEPLGISHMLGKLRLELFNKIPALKRYLEADRIPMPLVESWYQDKSIQIFDPHTKSHNHINIHEHCSHIIQDYCNKIRQRIKIANGVSDVFLLGGGALNQEIYTHLSEFWPNIYKPEAPDFANVKGLLKLETFVNDKNYNADIVDYFAKTKAKEEELA